MNIFKFAITVFILFSALDAFAKQSEGAKPTIEKFYGQYLDLAKRPRPRLPYSKSFQGLVDRNEEVCKQKAGTDVCGFGADGDVYLNAQEIDPKLTFKNSKFSASEKKPGQVEVNFNVYPSVEDKEGYYQRKILFQMIMERGNWVVDDIFYGNKSARKQIAEEIGIYTKER